MSLLDNTQLALESAMSGSMLRQTLLANDLANADTPNFKPEDVNFQQTLANAMSAGQSPTSVQYTPYASPKVTGIDGNGVDSDLTNAEIAENGLLYQDMTQIAAAREGILETAMNTTTSGMSFFDALNISATGLTAERTQMDVTAENLANAQSTNNGTPVQAAGGRSAVDQLRQQLPGRAAAPRSAAAPSTPGGVEVSGIVNENVPDQLVYDPGNPQANKQGYVKEPNIQPVTEMTNLISESNAYQADVTAMDTSKQMYSETLDLLK